MKKLLAIVLWGLISAISASEVEEPQPFVWVEIENKEVKKMGGVALAVSINDKGKTVCGVIAFGGENILERMISISVETIIDDTPYSFAGQIIVIALEDKESKTRQYWPSLIQGPVKKRIDNEWWSTLDNTPDIFGKHCGMAIKYLPPSIKALFYGLFGINDVMI